MSTGPASQVSKLEGDSVFNVLQGFGATLGLPLSDEKPAHQAAAECRPGTFSDEGEYVTLPESITAKGVWPPLSPLAAGTFRSPDQTLSKSDVEQVIPRNPLHAASPEKERNKHTNLPFGLRPGRHIPTSSVSVQTFYRLRTESGRTSRQFHNDTVPQVDPRAPANGWLSPSVSAPSQSERDDVTLPQRELVPFKVTSRQMPKASADSLASSFNAVPSAALPSDQIQSLMKKHQEILVAKPHPFLCADEVKHAECREDGKLPNIRVPFASRGPSLLFGLDGGEYGGEYEWDRGTKAKVVCHVTLGQQSFRTLAAEIRADGTWASPSLFALPLDARQVQHLAMETSRGGNDAFGEHVLKCETHILETGDHKLVGTVYIPLKDIAHLADGREESFVAHLAGGRDNSQKARVFLSASWGLGSVKSWAPPCLEDIVRATDEAALAASILDDEVQTTDKASAGEGYESEDSEEEELKAEEMHWREQLERLVDSLAVNVFVMLLVILDVILAIVFDFAAQDTVVSGDRPLTQKNEPEVPPQVTGVQAVILFLFGK